jgi:hypothetical protein
MQLSKKLDKLKRAITKPSTKLKKRRKDNSDFDSKYRIRLDSIGKSIMNLAETAKMTKFTPPSPIKATPTLIARNQDDVCLKSFRDAGDIMMTSSSQNKEGHDNYSTPTTKDSPEGKPRQ